MAMLEINHLQKKFGTTEVLRDVSLSVSKGDVVAILGPSGSGKTTLLRCVNFLERADAGELLFDDEKFDLNRASHRDIARIRQKTAFVFQNYNLFRNKTALQNVTEGLIVARKMKKSGRGSDWAEATGQGGLVRPLRPLSCAIVRRTAAARRDCPRAGDESGNHLLR